MHSFLASHLDSTIIISVWELLRGISPSELHGNCCFKFKKKKKKKKITHNFPPKITKISSAQCHQRNEE